jgi:uncharacterized membrane protein HdeD (DUF308 family)
MLRNRKAHIDPICIITTLVLIILGLVALFFPWGRSGVPSFLIVGFAFMALISQIVHLFHDGLRPISGIMSLLVFIVAILMLRSLFGTGGDIAGYYLENVKLVIPAIIALDFIKLISP